MRNKKIAFDLDGVVYDFMKPFDKFVKDYGIPLLDDSYYDLFGRYGLNDKESRLLLDNFGRKRPFKWIPLFEKAKEEMINTFI
jgi:beta-phosphoglucomutase-like phosphatase (HAD superfamily)